MTKIKIKIKIIKTNPKNKAELQSSLMAEKELAAVTVWHLISKEPLWVAPCREPPAFPRGTQQGQGGRISALIAVNANELINQFCLKPKEAGHFLYI